MKRLHLQIDNYPEQCQQAWPETHLGIDVSLTLRDRVFARFDTPKH
jgi:hypothetical protein